MIHKWQTDADPEVIGLHPPVLLEPCLHAGQNILKNTNLAEDPSADTFTKDFMLVMSSPNGFKKEFPLRKNFGAGGWELNLTKEDINSFPKIEMEMEAYIQGTRGFNEIKSPGFKLPLAIDGQWQLKEETQKAFSVGGKRTVTVSNMLGNCRCLQAIIYKPSFGGQFIFAADGRENGLQFSVDGKEASFEVDASSFQPGQGTLELRTYGGEATNLNIKLYPLPPNITDVKASRGDSHAVISGERLEQIDYVMINGKKANVVGKVPGQSGYGNTGVGAYGNQTQGQYQNQYQQPSQQQNQYPNQQNQYNQPNQNNQAGQYPNQQGYPQSNQYPNQNPGYGQPQAQQYPQQNQYPNQQGVSGDTGAGAYGNPQNPNTQPPNTLNTYPSNSLATSHLPLNTLSPNEKIVIFEEPNTRILSNQVTIELVLEEDRRVAIDRTFNITQSRPAIVANPSREIEAIPTDSGKSQTVNEERILVNGKPKSRRAKTNSESLATNRSQLLTSTYQLSPKEALPITTSSLILNLQNPLTDYDFKVENITIETRAENSQGYIDEAPRVTFEVLDWRNIRIDLSLSEAVQKTLGGRRLQFRIRDRERGDSDWYTIKQTFIRQATIKSIRCTNEMNGMCEMKGEGIDYIQQVSVDNGQTWYPQEPQTLTAQPTQDGQKMAMIPNITNKKLLKIKLRDYPKEPVSQMGFTLTNTVRLQRNTNQASDPTKSIGVNPAQQPNISGYPQQPVSGTNQPLNEATNQSSKPKSGKGKKKRR